MMQNSSPIPDDLRRFILNSIDSVPHLEAILLFYNEPTVEWDAKMIAQRLFVGEKKASLILEDLSAGGFACVKKDEVPVYRYQPSSLELEKIISRLAQVYSSSLIEVTNLIHSKINKQAQSFGDAFKWQKDKD